jgi:hypothetical protein
MVRNVGSMDRWLRGIAAGALGACAAMAPLGAPWRVAFAATAAYFVFSALAGTCLGYRLMGRSTCPSKEPS